MTTRTANGCAVTVAGLASAKALPAEFLAELGLRDLPNGAVAIPYFGVTGEEIAVKRRTAMTAKQGSYWPKGTPLAAYGQWRLDRASRAGFLILVEGESDCWALWYHNLPALGIPGANAAKTLEREHVESVSIVYVHREPDNGGKTFIEGVAKRLEALAFEGRVFELRMPEGVKDPADLHVQDAAAFERQLETAIRGSAPLDMTRTDGGWRTYEQANGRETPDAWETPIPFADLPRPEFPVECLLSASFVNSVHASAEETQTPVDLAAMLLLGVTGAGLARKVRVCPRPGWTEPTNLYALVALPPGNRKSAVFSRITAPVAEYELELTEEQRPIIAEAASVRRMLEGRLKHAESRAAKTEDELARGRSQQEAKDLARELAENRVPMPPQVIADDVTPEKLAALLADQGGRLLVASAEGTIIDVAKGRYSDAPNFDVLLKAHAGDTIRVNRVGREPDYIEQPALSLALAVQPDVIAGLAEHASMRGRGLLARFAYSMPRSTVGERRVRADSIPPAVERLYREKMLALWRIPGLINGKGEPAPYLLPYSPEADDELERFETWLEPQLGEGGQLECVADWVSKLAGLAVRLSGILHVAQAIDACRTFQVPVSIGAVRAAICIAQDYLLPHARAAFGHMGADSRVEDAKRLLRAIRRDGKSTFTKRDAHRIMGDRIAKVEDLEPILDLLAKHGHIRPEPQQDREGRGRKPSPTYQVNPVHIAGGIPIDA